MAEEREHAPPDPRQAADVAEFIDMLRRLRVWAGSPSFRTIAERIGVQQRSPHEVPKSTVGDVFNTQRRRLSQDVVVAVVRALGLDEEAVDLWRTACIRVHADAGAGGQAGVLRQLPRTLSTFTGREDEIRRLMDTAAAAHGASDSVTVLAVDGTAGVGKTQLALHVAHKLVREGRYGDAQLYANLRGFDSANLPVHPADVLDAFLRSLGVPGRSIPADLDARAAMFRDRIHDLDALILLDNAADEHQVRDLIPAGPNCLVIVTSRRSLAGLDGASLHRLAVLSPAESLELLARVAGTDRIDAEPEAAARIAEACSNLPLALSLTAAHLRNRPTWSLADTSARLGTGDLSLLALGGRTIRTVFDVSYQGLSERGRGVFRLLGLHPGDGFDTAAVAALADLAEPQAGPVLDELLDHHLVEETSPGRYALHDLLREFSREAFGRECSASAREAALSRLIDHYCHTASCAMDATGWRSTIGRRNAAGRRPGAGFPGSAQALEWLDAERPTLLAIAQTAAGSRPAQVSGLSQTLAAYLRERTYFSDALRLHSLGAAAARSRGDGTDLARSLFHAGNVHGCRGDFKGALRSFEEAFAVCEDQHDRLAVLTGLGQVENELGHYRTAIGYFRQALETNRAIGDRWAEGGSLNALGYACFLAGSYQDAVDYLSAGLDLGSQGGAYLEILVTLSLVLERSGDFAPAERHIRKALEISTAEGNAWIECHALNILGRLLGHRGRADLALGCLERALAMHREFGNGLGEADVLLSLGAQHLRSGRGEKAEEAFRQAWAIAGTIEAAPRRIEATHGVGEAMRAMSRTESALEYYGQALRSALETDDLYWQARSHEGLGRTFLDLGDRGKARDHLARAADLCTALGLRTADSLRSELVASAPDGIVPQERTPA